MNDSKVHLSIGVKYSLIIGIMLLLSLASVTLVDNYLIRTSEGVSAEANNLTLNSRTATSVEKEITSICSSAFQLIDQLYIIADKGSSELLNSTQELFFKRNQSIVSVMITDEKGSIVLEVDNDSSANWGEDQAARLNEFVAANAGTIRESCGGKTMCLNSTPAMGFGSIAMFFPWGAGNQYSTIIVFTSDSISEAIATAGQSINSTFIVNYSGDYIIHSDAELILSNANAGSNPLVQEMLGKTDNNGQTLYSDSGSEYFGAYKKIPSLNIGVLTTAESSLVYEGINRTTRNNIYLTIVILGLTVFIVLMYTHFGISKPLKLLKLSVEEITKGNFKNTYKDLLSVKRRDEIGVLNSGINDECEFLETFARYTNHDVATGIATKTLDFESHLKDVTVFFSDIRGFTKISDEYKKRYGNDSATQIIGFLNDYMNRMVQCVKLSGGNIDKFEGDAIMAVWGLLRSDDLGFESMEDCQEKTLSFQLHRTHVLEDAVNCITGTIAMRYALMEYNVQAAAYTREHSNDAVPQYKPQIKIGCGINSGRASVGNIGSPYKMEYTSIGDAVNFASRTEASNKVCGTDILISQDTYNLLKENYIRCEENNFTIQHQYLEKEIVVEKIPVAFDVKGKGKQYFYGVVNMPNFDIEKFFGAEDRNFKIDAGCSRACGKDGPSTLDEVRQLLGIEKPDFDGMDLNEEENKVQISR